MRSLLKDKRGAEEDTLSWIIELGLIALLFTTMLMLVHEVRTSTILEKNYLAREFALLLDTVYASPDSVKYVYDGDASDFIVLFEENRVKVREERDTLSKEYWFADAGEGPAEEELTHPDDVVFIERARKVIVTDDPNANPAFSGAGRPVLLPANVTGVMQYICMVAPLYNVPGDLMLALAQKESGLSIDALSGDGGVGVFQVTNTACDERSLMDGRVLEPLASWTDNVECGIQIFRNKCLISPGCASGAGRRYCCRKRPTDSWSACLCDSDGCSGSIMKDVMYTGYDIGLRGYNGWGCSAALSSPAPYHTPEVTAAVQAYVEGVRTYEQGFQGTCASLGVPG